MLLDRQKGNDMQLAIKKIKSLQVIFDLFRYRYSHGTIKPHRINILQHDKCLGIPLSLLIHVSFPSLVKL